MEKNEKYVQTAAPMLFRIEPEQFWQMLRILVHEEVNRLSKPGQSPTFQTPVLTQAQDIVKGSLDFLKGVTEMNVVFKYDKLLVGEDGKEASYIKRKKAEKDAKEPGSAAVWEQAWYADRTEHFSPKFKQLFAKYGDIELKEDSTLKYAMVVNTKTMEIGYNVGVASRKAYVSLEIEIFSADNMKKSVCKIMMDNVTGGKGQFDTGMRIGEAYVKAGKELGKLVHKKIS